MGKKQSTTNYWQDRNVLITGGTGFVGNWLAKDLVEREANVYILAKDGEEIGKQDFSKEPKKIIFGDINQFSSIEKILFSNKINDIFHLAAQALPSEGIDHPRETIQTNVMGTTNLIDACRKSKEIKSIVIASSINAYGNSQKLPFTEETPFKKGFPYDVSKACTDEIARSFAETYNMPIKIARCSNIYGPGDLNFKRLAPKLIKCLIEDKGFILRNNGEHKRGFFYISDAIEGYKRLAESKVNPGEAFNFGPDKPVKLIEFVNNLIKCSGKEYKKLNIISNTNKEITDQYHDSSKAKKTLNWNPKYHLKKGLEETFIWYEEYFKKNGKN